MVSMPYDGLFSFLRCRYERSGNVIRGVNALWRAFFISTTREGDVVKYSSAGCQCPMTGFFHFYTAYTTPPCRSRACQCPMTGFFHFYTAAREADDVIFGGVSMPYDGLFSFLPMRTHGTQSSFRGCQCPMTGFFHFYLCSSSSWDEKDLCQCPMTGFFHFYGGDCCRAGSSKQCQCPMTGFFHFYAPGRESRFDEYRHVSMPYDGLFSFLHGNGRSRVWTSYCVNALWRAFFISTKKWRKKLRLY